MSTNTRSRQNEAQKSNYTGSAYWNGSAQVDPLVEQPEPACSCYYCAHGYEHQETRARQSDAEFDEATVSKEGKFSGDHRTKWNDRDGNISPNSKNRALFCLQADFPHPSGWKQVGSTANRESEQRAFGVAVAHATFEAHDALPDWIRESTVRDEAKALDVDVNTQDAPSKGGYTFTGMVAILRLLNLKDEEKLAIVKNDTSGKRGSVVEAVNEYVDSVQMSRRKLVSALIKEVGQ